MKPPIIREFAKARRREARKKVGMSIKDVAYALGRCPAYMSRLERTGRVPHHLARAWSRLLGCQIELFL